MSMQAEITAKEKHMAQPVIGTPWKKLNEPVSEEEVAWVDKYWRTANFLDCDGGKGGAHYSPQGSICLETQLFPDSINHPEWPSPIITPEHPFAMRTRMTFSLA